MTVERTIAAAIGKLDLGTLNPGGWGLIVGLHTNTWVSRSQCCALSAVLVGQPVPADRNHGLQVGALLGVSQGWVDGFVLGFDGYSLESAGNVPEYAIFADDVLLQEGYEMGLRFRWRWAVREWS